MRITTKGQVTIPQHLREKWGLLPNTEVAFIEDSDGVKLVKVKHAKGKTRGDEIVELLMSGGPHLIMSPDEIMRLTRGED
jgi:AbrB family looped-hinge helix DNA binding protein